MENCTDSVHYSRPYWFSPDQVLTTPPPSWSSPDPGAHITSIIMVLTIPKYLHHLGPSAMMRQFQSLPHHSHITTHITTSLSSSHLTTHNFTTLKSSQPSPSLDSHITKPSHHHPPATGLSYAPVGLPPPSLSQVPSAEAGSSLMMEDSQPHHLQNVTIYAAETVSQGVPSVVKLEEETFDGVEGGASCVGCGQ